MKLTGLYIASTGKLHAEIRETEVPGGCLILSDSSYSNVAIYYDDCNAEQIAIAATTAATPMMTPSGV